MEDRKVLDQNNAQKRKRRQELKDAGLCIYCYKSNFTKFNLCESCHQKHLESGTKSKLRLKLEVYAAYGGRCSCLPCGETRWQFLTLDHVNGDGGKHRIELGGSADKLCQWAKENNFPPTLRLMCINCNMGRYRNGGDCPHLTEAGPTTPC